MKDRIKELRKCLKVSQTEFAETLKISRSALCKIESGENNPSEQTIELIVSKYKVNEKWLRTGQGEMFVNNAINLSGFSGFNDLPPDEQDMIEEFITVYLELDDISREAIRSIVHKLSEKKGS